MRVVHQKKVATKRTECYFLDTVNECIGRSRGGLTTKIHLVSNGYGVPVAFQLSGGQVADIKGALSLLELLKNVYKPRYLIADRAYDAYDLRAFCRAHRMRAVVPEKQLAKGKRRRRKGRPSNCKKEIYNSRNVIERVFGQLKDFRHIAFRFDKYALHYAGFLNLGIVMRKLRNQVLG